MAKLRRSVRRSSYKIPNAKIYSNLTQPWRAINNNEKIKKKKNPENPEYPKKRRIPLFNCNGKHVLHEWILKAMWVGKRCKGTPQSPQIPKDSLLPRKFYDNGKHQRAHQCSHIQFHRWKTSNLARQCSGASEILKTKENL